MAKLRLVKGEQIGNELSEGPVMNNRPSFSLVETDFPEIRDWTVGESQELELEVEVVSISKNEYGKTPMTARLRVIRGGMADKEGAEDAETPETTMAKKGFK